MKKIISVIGISLALAGSSGFFLASALGQSNSDSTKTVTITLHNGATGPTGPTGPIGPQGPKGDPGTIKCPSSFETGEVVINHPGGQVIIFGCIKE